MRVALVSVAAGPAFQQLAEVVNPAKREYCRRFGYDFIHFNKPLDGNRPPAWSKIPAVLQVLPRYDWVLWHDTDTVLWRPHSIREYVQACGHAFLLVQSDGLGLNSGVFLVRNVPRAHQFLAAAWRRTDLIHHCVWEQAAIAAMSGSPAWRDGVRVAELGELSPPLQKCFLRPHDRGWDCLLLHLAGFHDRRLERLTNLVELARLPADQRLPQAASLGSFLNQRQLLGNGAVVGVANVERSATILARWDGRRLDAVDPWFPLRPVLDPRLRVRRQCSLQFAGTTADRSLDFVCLDGAHQSGGRLAELQTWFPKVRPEGLVAGTCGNRSGLHGAASVPPEIRSWCQQHGVPLGVTGDWPEPTWYFLKAQSRVGSRTAA